MSSPPFAQMFAEAVHTLKVMWGQMDQLLKREGFILFFLKWLCRNIPVRECVSCLRIKVHRDSVQPILSGRCTGSGS